LKSHNASLYKHNLSKCRRGCT